MPVQQVVLVVAVTFAACLVLYFLLILVLSGFNFSRIRLALRCELKALRDRSFKEKVEPLLLSAKSKPATAPKPSAAPLRLLALLQREGRLLDFLLEDIHTYPDVDVGAAVRDIHRQCQAAIKEHLVLEPVLPRPERSEVEIPSGFDPAAVRLTGNVTGQPPFKGTLQHHGWRVKEIKLAPPPEGQDEFIIMPAEVELP
ncbi:MAG TPA: DUF2760 domain-containing protein [Gemmataceae bacterium]|jgi:hypothetical protein|nr:DUF2760 domain-containing protein [Gemmataceae bacterium]